SHVCSQAEAVRQAPSFPPSAVCGRAAMAGRHEQVLTPKGRQDAKGRVVDDWAAKRLENAVWRMWRKDSRDNLADLPACPEEDTDGSFLQKVQEAIGEACTFPEIKFPQAGRGNYDDLPTFPIRPNFAGFKNELAPASECVVFDGCPEDPRAPQSEGAFG
ncbi:unnamed protein product, partial [Prorocentrum cordatum]